MSVVAVRNQTTQVAAAKNDTKGKFLKYSLLCIAFGKSFTLKPDVVAYLNLYNLVPLFTRSLCSGV